MNEHEIKRLRSIAGYLDGKRSMRPHILSLAYSTLRRPMTDTRLDRLLFQALEDMLKIEMAHILAEEDLAQFATNSLLINDYSYTHAIDKIWKYCDALAQANKSLPELAGHLANCQRSKRPIRRPIEIEIPYY